MSFKQYLNIEPLTLKIINQYTENMTNTNIDIENEPFCDEKQFKNNIECGFVIITMLNVYVESVLNDIIRDYTDICNSEKEKYYNKSIVHKVNFISKNKGINIKRIKKLNCYKKYIKMKSLRNGLIHFKGISEYAGGIPSFKLEIDINSKKENIDLSKYFTKNEMIYLKESVIEFIDIFIKECGLIINNEIDLFSCDGCGNFQYITDTILD